MTPSGDDLTNTSTPEREAAMLNDWFLSLPEPHQKALLDGGMWMLADAAFHAGRAALASSPAAAPVPAGWKLVPLVPTAEMAKAAADAWLDSGSRLILNRAGSALTAGISAAKEIK